MSEEVEAARSELREALAVARASLAQVRSRPATTAHPGLDDASRADRVHGDDA